MTPMITVRILDETNLLFDGRAQGAHLPGAEGEFEVGFGHAPTLSLLKKGRIVLVGPAQPAGGPARQRTAIPIQRGIAKMEKNRLLAVVEQ